MKLFEIFNESNTYLMLLCSKFSENYIDIAMLPYKFDIS